MDARRIDELVEATDRWYGGVPVPDWFDPDVGETVYAVVSDAEFVELRSTAAPLDGGTSDVDAAAASAMSVLQPGATRSVRVDEPVLARDAGVVLITSKRIVFHGNRDCSWRLQDLDEVAHDHTVPETWLPRRSKKRIAGLRYPGTAALQVRFTIALAIATLRQERPALRAALVAQRPAEQRVASPLPIRVQPDGGSEATSAWVRMRRGLGFVYLGKKGVAPPLRIAQGMAAGLATLALLGAILPDPAPRDVELIAAEGSEESARELARDAAAVSERKDAEQAAKREADEQAKVAAEQEAARKAAEEEAARKAAEEAARAAAEQEAARVAAEQEAARKAAEAAAADAARVAAERAAAEKAAADAAAATQMQSLVAPPPATRGGGSATDPRFRTCKEAKANGYGNYRQGTDPEYDWYRDADNDGIVCE